METVSDTDLQEELEARILRHLRERGEGRFGDFAVAPALGKSGETFDAWSELLARGEIEYAPGSCENIYLARFRIKAQMRLF